MKYLALIYSNEAKDATASPEEQNAIMEGHGVFAQLAAAKMVGGEALLPTTTATTIRLRGGEILISDGPFAETKEQLGGYYLLECENLDEAIALAAKIPQGIDGAVEVRPIMVFE